MAKCPCCGTEKEQTPPSDGEEEEAMKRILSTIDHAHALIEKRLAELETLKKGKLQILMGI